jgi:hypothetical protein
VAEWSEEDLEIADDFARQVIRNIRAQRFWPPVKPAPLGFPELASICQEERLIPEESDEGESAD